MARELKTFEYVKDYELAGKKKGDKIKLAKLPHHLKQYLKEVGSEDEDERPDESWTKGDITAWLIDHGVEEPKGTKEQLLELVEDIK